MNMKKSKSVIEIFKADTKSSVELPFAEEGIRAGFPSPAQDYLDLSIDLNNELIKLRPLLFMVGLKVIR